jgi:hypothetical protein
MFVSREVQVTTVSWRTLDKRPLSVISLAFWVGVDEGGLTQLAR